MSYRNSTFILLTSFLFACGGDEFTHPHLLDDRAKGQVISDYFRNAKVCVDKNENLKCDDDELSVYTDENGYFSFLELQPAKEKKLIAVIAKDTLNEQGGAPEYGYTLTGIEGCPLISPSTSIASYINSTVPDMKATITQYKESLLTSMEVCTDYQSMIDNPSLNNDVIFSSDTIVEEAKHMARISHVYSEIIVNLMEVFNSTTELQEGITYKQKVEHANFLFYSWTDDVLRDLNDIRKAQHQPVDATPVQSVSSFVNIDFDFDVIENFRVEIATDLQRTSELLRQERERALRAYNAARDMSEQMEVVNRKREATPINVTRYLADSTANLKGFHWYQSKTKRGNTTLSYVQLLTSPYSDELEVPLVGNLSSFDLDNDSDSFIETNSKFSHVVGAQAILGNVNPEVTSDYNYVFGSGDNQEVLTSINIDEAERIEEETTTPPTVKALDDSYSFTIEAKRYSVAGLKVSNVLKVQKDEMTSLSSWTRAIKNQEFRFPNNDKANAFDVTIKAKGSFDVDLLLESEKSKQAVMQQGGNNTFNYHAEYNGSLNSLIGFDGHTLVPLIVLYQDGTNYIAALARYIDENSRTLIYQQSGSRSQPPRRYVNFYRVAEPYSFRFDRDFRNFTRASVLSDLIGAERLGSVHDFKLRTENGVETLSFDISEAVRRRNPDFPPRITLFSQDGAIHRVTSFQDGDIFDIDRFTLGADTHKTLIEALGTR